MSEVVESNLRTKQRKDTGVDDPFFVNKYSTLNTQFCLVSCALNGTTFPRT